MDRITNRTTAGGPAGPSLVDADRRLLRELDEGFRAVAREAGSHLACKAGCSECCIGPFPVTRLDARRLRQGLAELAARDPAGAAAIAERAEWSVATLREGFPGDPRSGTLNGTEEVLDGFFERHSGLPCPVLDPETGTCTLYAWRPVACRTYGPPLLYDREKAAPCRLCFVDAPPDLVERCRFRPDPEGLEAAILARIGVGPGDDWETVIAHALRSPAGHGGGPSPAAPDVLR